MQMPLYKRVPLVFVGDGPRKQPISTRVGVQLVHLLLISGGTSASEGKFSQVLTRYPVEMGVDSDSDESNKT